MPIRDANVRDLGGTNRVRSLVEGPADNADLADMAAATIKLRASGAGAGPPIDGTGAQANAIIGAFAVIRQQTFTASGTYTPHANMVYCIIECLGGGASGAGGTGSATCWMVGGGGGSGGYSRMIASKATIGSSQTVTIGAKGSAPAAGNNDGNAGGDTSVGTLCIAKGGSGGKHARSATNPQGGGGGVPGTGDIAAPGHCGQGGVNSLVDLLVYVGQGADTIWGTGALAQSQGGAGSTSTGNGAAGYGAGGGGGNAHNSTSTFAGGDGVPGIAVITEFCSA